MRFNLHHLGLLRKDCLSHVARHKIKPHRVSVATRGINFPVQQEEAVTAGQGALSQILTETCHITSKHRAQSPLQASGTNALTSCTCRHLRLAFGSLWTVLLLTMAACYPLPVFLRSISRRCSYCPKRRRTSRLWMFWEMGRNKMEGGGDSLLPKVNETTAPEAVLASLSTDQVCF